MEGKRENDRVDKDKATLSWSVKVSLQPFHRGGWEAANLRSLSVDEQSSAGKWGTEGTMTGTARPPVLCCAALDLGGGMGDEESGDEVYANFYSTDKTRWDGAFGAFSPMPTLPTTNTPIPARQQSSELRCPDHSGYKRTYKKNMQILLNSLANKSPIPLLCDSFTQTHLI